MDRQSVSDLTAGKPHVVRWHFQNRIPLS